MMGFYKAFESIEEKEENIANRHFLLSLDLSYICCLPWLSNWTSLKFCCLFNTLSDDKILRLIQIETNCRRHYEVHLKWKTSTI